jgi:hypothetical protein
MTDALRKTGFFPFKIRTGRCILQQGFLDDEQLATFDFGHGPVSIYEPAVV